MLVPFIRTLILYLVIIAAVRLMGKRQVGELQPSELVITILVSAVASVPVQDIDIPLSHGIVPILTLMSAEVIISSFSQNHIKFRRLLTGNPVLVIKDGNFVQTGINKLRLSIDDILANLRLNGVFDIRDVVRGQIETNGQLSTLLRADRQPVTLNAMGIKPVPSGPFYTLISDGRVISDNLKSVSKNEKWLESIIHASGANSTSEVFFLCADQYGNTVFSKKEM
ncbi:MAG: DUF421 domain-containing protein [Clostridiaceae bacterium]|nr:DUF421 domain-containing protein [Clostridiaceae bacterium]